MKFDPFAVIRKLQSENAKLRRENAELQAKAGKYLANWVAAQDLAYNRQILALITNPNP